MVLLVGADLPCRGQDRPPLLVLRGLVAARQGKVEANVDQARRVLRPLKITSHPVNAVGRPPKHQSSSTQVSLVPPPCEELTTRDPFLSATRVDRKSTRLNSSH